MKLLHSRVASTTYNIPKQEITRISIASTTQQSPQIGNLAPVANAMIEIVTRNHRCDNQAAIAPTQLSIADATQAIQPNLAEGLWKRKQPAFQDNALLN